MAPPSPFPLVEEVDVNSMDWNAFSKWRDIQTQFEDGVLTVRLYRPKHMNAFTIAMQQDLAFAFELADADDRVKAVVLTGDGTRAFCAGADLSGDGFGGHESGILHWHRDGGGQAALAIFNCRKLVIAAVQGSAVGVGMTMVLPADIRFVSESAKIAFPFAKRGIALEATSSYILPRLIGHSKALELTMTGDVISPSNPAVMPLWRAVLPAEQVYPEALALAKRLAVENSVASMAITKNLLWRGLGSPEETHLLDSQVIAAMGTIEGNEGIQSFLKKRKPQWKGTVHDLEKQPFYPWWRKIDVRNGFVPRAPRKIKL